MGEQAGQQRDGAFDKLATKRAESIGGLRSALTEKNFRAIDEELAGWCFPDYPERDRYHQEARKLERAAVTDRLWLLIR